MKFDRASFLRARPLATLAATLLVSCGGGASNPEPGSDSASLPRPKSVLLITIDTLRADRVSFGGYSLPTTPFLDEVASQGVVFERAYATSSWTLPSMASLVTGTAPMTHGVTSVESRGKSGLRQSVLPRSLVTIAELFQGAGYFTIGVPANRHLSTPLGFAQGFDRYVDPERFPASPVLNDAARILLRQEYGAEWGEALRKRPTLLWLHYFDPHDPYLPYGPWIERHAPGADARGPDSPARKVMRQLRRQFPRPDAALAERIRPIYDSEIFRNDGSIRTLWNELGVDDDTLVVFTADHGEEFAEHGQLGHSQSLYEELVHVPLFVRWPRGLAAGVRVKEPVSHLDLLPTLYDLLDLPVPENLPGVSLMPQLLRRERSPVPAIARPVFLELAPPKPFRWAVVDGMQKLIVDPRPDGTAELYDLADDPREQRNLSAERPGEVERLRQELREWHRRQPRAPDQETYDANDEKLRRELEALGYIGGSEAPAAAHAPDE